jgi:RNA polymerase sigma factor (TIGR02999 family)
MSPKSGEMTRLLAEVNGGKVEAGPQLFEVVYDDLRAVASNLMRREGPGHVLQTTALVNESFVRLFAGSQGSLADREHFFRIAARAMRRILIDEARSRNAVKRGGGGRQVTLHEWMQVSEAAAEDQIELQKALDDLAALDPRQAQIMELLVFSGRTKQEISEVLSISVRTIEREIAAATLFLRRRIAGAE